MDQYGSEKNQDGNERRGWWRRWLGKGLIPPNSTRKEQR
jgi:hypothetical protein